jgi:polyphosphate kinase 2 (PPK2 family)
VDESGKISMEYYNTDQAKRHLIIVEGMDESGRMGLFSKIFE